MSFSRKNRSIKSLTNAFIAVFLALLIVQPVSAAVTLVYFRATGSPSQISIEWQTASEIDMVGFFVLKSETVSGDYEPISSLIYALGDSFGGATYFHVDSSINQGQTYYYKLQVLDRNQNFEYFGPIAGYAGNETQTPTITLTIISVTPTITITGTIAPTLTKTSLSPTHTRTPIPLPTTTLQVLSSTRTATNTIIPTAQIENVITNTPEPNAIGLSTATNTVPKIILPSKTVLATDDNVPQQLESKKQDVIGWLLVGIGGAGLLIGAGWLVWAIIQQKSSE